MALGFDDSAIPLRGFRLCAGADEVAPTFAKKSLVGMVFAGFDGTVTGDAWFIFVTICEGWDGGVCRDPAKGAEESARLGSEIKPAAFRRSEGSTVAELVVDAVLWGCSKGRRPSITNSPPTPALSDISPFFRLVKIVGGRCDSPDEACSDEGVSVCDNTRVPLRPRSLSGSTNDEPMGRVELIVASAVPSSRIVGRSALSFDSILWTRSTICAGASGANSRSGGGG